MRSGLRFVWALVSLVILRHTTINHTVRSRKAFLMARSTPLNIKVSRSWQVGREAFSAQQSSGGLSPHGEVIKITDASDPRLVLYRRKNQRDHNLFQLELRRTSALAIDGCTQGPLANLTIKDVSLEVHYGWECLESLELAALNGSCMRPLSALLLEGAASGLQDLVCRVCMEVFVVPLPLAQEFCMNLEWGTPVRYLVTWPVPLPLSVMHPPFLVFDGLVSSQNVGQLIRSACLLGVDSFIVSRATWKCLNGRACHISRGWLYHSMWHLSDDLPATLAELKTNSVRIYGAEEIFPISAAPHSPHGDRNWALVVGNEDKGVSKEVVTQCDIHIRVPQCRGASLNVAHAATICIYELGKFMGDRPSTRLLPPP